MSVTVAKVVEMLKTGKRRASPNAHGNAVYDVFLPDERYMIDFAPDFTSEGWQQFDTSQDAHYFGVWVNRSKRLTLTYAEGDWTLVECPTVESYKAEILGMCECYGEGMICRTIDAEASHIKPWSGPEPRVTVTTYVQDRAKMFLEGL